jgi:hypothetical protein
MILYIYAFVFFVTSSSSAMVFPTFNALCIAKRHDASDTVDSSAKWQAKLKYTVNPNLVALIVSGIVSLPEGKAVAYDATLRNGDQVTCFLILEGEFKNEKWALLYKQDLPPVPIPNTNFDIVKKIYQRNKNI